MGIIETALGVLIGALVTVFASRYYFRRSISKSLGVYGLLDSFVFQGIAPDVRDQLQFRFQGREVKELQQVIFLVANDGERAIRDFIELPKVTIPADVEVLDASIVHRQPEGLRANILISRGVDGTELGLEVPLLNKREFFVVKLLLSGRFKFSELTLLCDDLPRCVHVEQIPPTAVEDPNSGFEWGALLSSLVLLSLAGWACYAGYLLHALDPSLFRPFALHSPGLHVHFGAAIFLVLGVIVVAVFSIIGFSLLGLAIFGGEFPIGGGPRFRLPRDLRGMVFPYHVLLVSKGFGDGGNREADRKDGGKAV